MIRSIFVCGSLLLLMGVFSLFPLMALDLPLHLKMGEIILQKGEVPRTNEVLHTQKNTPLVNDKWLHQVAVHLTDQAAGATGLLLFRLVLALGITLGAYRLARRFARPGPAGLGVLGITPLLVHRLSLRPELWTVLFTILFLTVLLGKRRRLPVLLFILLPLQALWVNLHVYFPLGPLLALLAGLSDCFRPARRANLLIAPVLLLPCLLNPSGLDGLLHPLEVVASLDRLTGGAVSELDSVWSPNMPWTLPRFVLIGLLLPLALGLIRTRFRAPARIWLLALPLLALGTVLHRNLPLAGIGMLLFLTVRPPVRSNRSWIAIPVVSLVLGTLVATGPLEDFAGDGRSFGTGWAEKRFPMKTTAFLVQDRPVGEIFNDLACSGYFLYKAYPDKRAFIDGNTAGYSRDFLEEYRRVLTLEIPHRALTRKYRVTHFLLRHDARATRLLLPALFHDEGLILAYYDAVATVFMAREEAPTIPDRRPEWLEQVLPHVRDSLFPDRNIVRPLLNQAVKLLEGDNMAMVLDLTRQACARDPWNARSFRLSAMVYRKLKKTDQEVRAWRIAALLEGQILRSPHH